MKIEINNNYCVIDSLYRPPKQNFVDFIEYFEDTVSDFTISYNNSVNLDNTNTQKCSSFLEIFYLQQVIDKPTRVTKSSKILLDVIVFSRSVSVYITSNLEVSYISDHCLVFCKFWEKTFENKTYVTFRNLKRINHKLLHEFMLNALFENIVYIN